MDRWTEFELFVQTAELGSLSKAAEQLDMSNATASRCLASLEKRLAARLIERNTRRLALTEIGESFYRRCKSILAEMKEAEAMVNATTFDPSGTLRITASLSFCMKHITPLLPEFTRMYPNIDVQIVAANRYFDLIDNGIDVAIRTKEYESDSDITVRKLAQTRRVLAASPSYLVKNGTPQTIEDLAHHKLLLYTYANKPNELHFTRDNKTQIIKVRSLLEANDGQILRTAALEGLGILIQPNYIIYDDVVAGRLIPILEEWDLPKLSINIAYQRRKNLPARVRAFIDFLIRHFREKGHERKWTR
ncbi:LysR family transcriptional regulator [Achromobacter mucicolens]|jgi:DNA-binding transcriptional LysR family regulator|uniref:LysR family transcriptional regulator n=2 Tax=Pseudomonadota TaxID=1224 RepID=A0ABD4Z4H3_9BURK|nr:LysR family transcriptional regulator [Achromobacter mucicolens]MDH1181989.1 LysR family transcriptional regulator [Achromobacter mucicolens]TXJ17548.1 MAG: LysR family transcriptional regulator [Alicycliphilus sp.]